MPPEASAQPNLEAPLPELDQPSPQPDDCEICGRETSELEWWGKGWGCIDYVGCIARGLATARRLGRRQRQLALWEELDGQG